MTEHDLDMFVDSAPLRDDCVLPYRVVRAGASGRVVRLGAALDQVLSGHDYPEPVSQLLGQAVAVTALLGASLKIEGKFILQTNTDGPVDMLVADYRSQGELRGYAHFDADKVAALGKDGDIDMGQLLGHGHLAMTIDQGPDTDRYQGIVALDGDDLNAAADTYFRQSEQLPTFIRVAVARHYDGAASAWTWRAGGLIVQQLSEEGGRATMESPVYDVAAEEAEDWNRVNLLAQTVEDHELLDPMLTSERLLYRLFHEERVRVYEPQLLAAYCRCSEKRVENIMQRFSDEDLGDMVEDGKIVVTCEFCGASYSFAPDHFNEESNPQA
jgi:molecular chaperone Hsp33